MNQFFKTLASSMEDRQEVTLNVKKIGDDLVVLAVPDAKKKGHAHQMSGTPDEIDEHFFLEFAKPISAKAGFTSNQVVAESEEDEDAGKNGKKKSSAKASKAAKKKEEKPERKKPGPKPGGAKKKKTDLEELKDKRANEKAEKQLTIEDPAPPAGPTEEEIKQQQEEAAAAAKKEAFEKAHKLAKFYMDEKKYEDAVSAYKLAIDEAPADIDSITMEVVKAGLEEAERKYAAWKTLNS